MPSTIMQHHAKSSKIMSCTQDETNIRDKYYDYLVHVPVITVAGGAAGGMPARATSAGTGCRLNELGGATRHPAHLTEEQVAQRAAGGGLAGSAAPSCSSQTRPTSSTPRGTGWSAPRARATGTPEPRRSPRIRGLRSVSFQLPCEEDVLPSAFEDKPLCVPRQLAELLQLSVEEVCADFDAMLRHDWRRLGISAERCESSTCGATPPCACLPGRGEADPAAHPRVEALRRRGRAAGAVLVRGPAEGGASLWPPARAPRWPSAVRRSTAG